MKKKLSKILNSYCHISSHEKRCIILEQNIPHIVDELFIAVKTTPMLPMIKVSDSLPKTYSMGENPNVQESEEVITINSKGEFKRGSLLKHGKYTYWYDTGFPPVEIENVIGWCKIPE